MYCTFMIVCIITFRSAVGAKTRELGEHLLEIACTTCLVELEAIKATNNHCMKTLPLFRGTKREISLLTRIITWHLCK